MHTSHDICQPGRVFPFNQKLAVFPKRKLNRFVAIHPWRRRLA